MDTDLTKRVTDKINELTELETTRKFGELNIVTDVSEMASGSVRVRFQPLSPYSPLAVDIGTSLRDAALSVEGVKAVRVECNGHIMDELVNRIVNREDIGQKKPQ